MRLRASGVCHSGLPLDGLISHPVELDDVEAGERVRSVILL